MTFCRWRNFIIKDYVGKPNQFCVIDYKSLSIIEYNPLFCLLKNDNESARLSNQRQLSCRLNSANPSKLVEKTFLDLRENIRIFFSKQEK